MNSIKLNTVLEKDGEIKIDGVPYKKGDKVEMLIQLDSETEQEHMNRVLSLPKHKLGSVSSVLNRESLYRNAR